MNLRADTLQVVLKTLNFSEAEVRRAEGTWAESLIRVLTHPVVSSILIAVGMLGIIMKIQSLGFGDSVAKN